jgi:phosphoglycerol transferase MdoB-like AlkP superfamily enzyme
MRTVRIGEPMREIALSMFVNIGVIVGLLFANHGWNPLLAFFAANVISIVFLLAIFLVRLTLHELDTDSNKKPFVDFP